LTALEFLGVAVNILLVFSQLDVPALLATRWPTLHQQLVETPALVGALIFIIIMNAFAVARAVLNHFVPDEPAAVTLERARQGLQRMKLFEREIAVDREQIALRVGGHGEDRAALARPLRPGDAFFEDALF